MNSFLSILKIAPHHIGVLQQLAPLLSAASEYQKGIQVFQAALQFYQTTMPEGPGDLEASDCLILIVTLADFCNIVGEHEQAINAVRDGARWLQGRSEQRYWSASPDDREYDVVGFIRPPATNELSRSSQASHALDPNLRHRLCLARLALGDIEEGQVSPPSPHSPPHSHKFNR